MHSLDLIVTLAGGLAAALAFGFVTHRIGLSPIVGYLMAGLLVGPHTPGFVADRHMAEQLAEVGIILLMFGVGLQFHLEELIAVWRVALPGAIVQSVVATLLGVAVGHMLGWEWTAGLVFGIGLAVASTVVLIRVLTDNRDLHTRAGHIAVGWLVVEDLLTVLVLVMMPALFGGAAGANAGISLSIAALKVAALTLLVLVGGRRVVPWLLTRVAETRSRELFTLTVLVLALGISIVSAELFGVSMALGAFLAGLVVGRSEFSVRAASEALPMRDAFAVLFFVSVGMLLDPGFVIAQPLLIAAALAIVVIGKPLTALALVLAWGYPLGVGLRIAVALAQIGEFSFIVASVGDQLGLVRPDVRNTLIAAAIVSIAVNPLLYRGIVLVERRYPQRTARVDLEATEESPADRDPRHRAVVVGYGPVGRTVARLLRENEVTPTIVDLNIETVRQLRDAGTPAIYGDASHRDTLTTAGIQTSGALVLSVAGLATADEIIRTSRELNPNILVLARTAYLREITSLKAAGANQIFSGEGEVALAFSQAILERLGATPEQMDHERARVHNELLSTGVDVRS
ncbi:MAG TPA: cation:proton antiporter [Vicinamibacterales bacterium]|nr:cation:proton antiporter [Vicinamibacterales bacterium]